MKRKRLQHIADNFCHIFTGWQGFSDYTKFSELGSGILIIDVISGKSYFNEEKVNGILIAEGLRKYLIDECKDNNIDLNFIILAQLAAKFQFSIIKWEEREYSLSEHFLADGEDIETENAYRCDFSCESTIQTNEKVYTPSKQIIKEWPIGWPSK